MAWTKLNTPATTKHNDLCSMAFGRLSPFGCCPRCDELHNGAQARAGWNDAKIKAEQQRSEAIKRHFAPGGEGYRKLQTGEVDTAFDW
jgi:hypothetical protein